MKKTLLGVLKFVVASALVGYGFYLYREGVMTTEDDNDPQVNPGKMLGLFEDKPGFGRYEMGFGAAIVAGLAVVALVGRYAPVPKFIKGLAPKAPAGLPGLKAA